MCLRLTRSSPGHDSGKIPRQQHKQDVPGERGRARVLQRGPVEFVARARVGAAPQERLDDVVASELTRPHQRGRSVGVRLVHVMRARLQQTPHALEVAPTRRAVQRGGARAGGRAEHVGRDRVMG